MKRLALIAAVACFLFPAALAQQPMVRVVHASPDAPAVDVLVNDTIRAFENVEFGEITDYAQLDAGVYNAKVVPEGAGPSSAVIDADLNLLWFQRYTVIAVNTLDAIEPLVIADTSPALVLPGRARVRFVHASPDAPAVDLRVEDGPFLFQNVSFRDVADYIDVPATTANIEVYVAGTDTLVLTVPAVSLESGTSYTAYAVGFAGGDAPALGAILSVDSETPFPVVIGGGGSARGPAAGGPVTDLPAPASPEVAPPSPIVSGNFERGDNVGRSPGRFGNSLR